VNQPFQHPSDINVCRASRNTTPASRAGIDTGNLWEKIKFLFKPIP
jgi:hypothetical protein